MSLKVYDLTAEEPVVAGTGVGVRLFHLAGAALKRRGRASVRSHVFSRATGMSGRNCVQGAGHEGVAAHAPRCWTFGLVQVFTR